MDDALKEKIAAAVKAAIETVEESERESDQQPESPESSRVHPFGRFTVIPERVTGWPKAVE